MARLTAVDPDIAGQCDIRSLLLDHPPVIFVCLIEAAPDRDAVDLDPRPAAQLVHQFIKR